MISRLRVSPGSFLGGLFSGIGPMPLPKTETPDGSHGPDGPIEHREKDGVGREEEGLWSFGPMRVGEEGLLRGIWPLTTRLILG